MKRILIATGLAAGLAAGLAGADEAWNTPIGEVVYDHDTPEGHAVLTYPIEGSDVLGLG